MFFIILRCIYRTWDDKTDSHILDTNSSLFLLFIVFNDINRLWNVLWFIEELGTICLVIGHKTWSKSRKKLDQTSEKKK